jgi:hypothetical protein
MNSSKVRSPFFFFRASSEKGELTITTVKQRGSDACSRHKRIFRAFSLRPPSRSLLESASLKCNLGRPSSVPVTSNASDSLCATTELRLEG